MAGGVHYHTKSRKWRARIRWDGRYYELYNETKEEALKDLAILSEMVSKLPVSTDKESMERKKAKRENDKAWNKRNMDKIRAQRPLKKKKRKQAMPKWARKRTLTKYIELKKEASTLQGTYHIDHVVPISGKLYPRHDLQLVCGLHVWYNLQLITAEENLKKGCYTWPHMPDYTEEDINEIRSRST